MAQATSIEWTDLSWNPVHGCSKVSPGCANCYAETLSLRYKQTLKPWTPANAVENVILKPHKLREPLSGAKQWRGLGDAARAAGKSDGKLVFVNSMSDLFHEQVPNEFIAAVFGVMAAAERHTFQVLTKRPERMREWFAWYANEIRDREHGWSPGAVAVDEARAAGVDERYLYAVDDDCPWPLPNVWLGVSIENRRFVGRADLLRETPAAVRFISAEPLLGPLVLTDVETEAAGVVCGTCGDEAAYAIGRDLYCVGCPTPDDLDLTGIHWLIVGGESGRNHRRVDPEWVRALRDAATLNGTAFFFKQWGGTTSKAGGRLLDGREWSEFPDVSRAVA